jgi:hypothetical protein
MLDPDAFRKRIAYAEQRLRERLDMANAARRKLPSMSAASCVGHLHIAHCAH